MHKITDLLQNSKIVVWIIIVILGGIIVLANERAAYMDKVDNNIGRIEKLEKKFSNTHDLLYEIRFNLKNDIELHGGKYIDNPPGENK